MKTVQFETQGTHQKGGGGVCIGVLATESTI
jgi:hypothetical protein